MPSEIRPESSKPIQSLESNLELTKDSRDQQTSRTVEKTILPKVRGSIKLRDRLEAEKTNLSYADFHHEITKNVKDISPSENHQRRYFEKKVTEDDELVKYMSNLPSYLQRGENLKEKALNVGVLDWGRLEKWQYNHKQIPHRGGRDSSSSSNTSSSFSTDVSSSHSSRGHSCSPARQSMHRPSLQSHLIASPGEVHPQVVKSFRENVGKFQDLKTAKSNFSNGLLKFPGKDQPFCKNHSEIKLEQTKRNDSGPKMVPEMRTSSNLGSYEVACSTKGEKKTREGELRTKAEKLPGSNSDVVDQNFPKRQNTVVLLLPRDLPQDGHSGAFQLSDSTMILSQRSAEASRRSFSEISRKVHHAESYSDIPHSCPLPCEVESNRHPLMKRSGSIDAESIKFSSNASHSVPCSTKIGSSPSRGRNLGEKKLTVRPTNATGNESLKGSVQKESKVACEKARSSSPFRRLSIGMGKISKSSISKEGLALPQFSSTHISAKSVSENAVASACSDTSTSDKLTASGRARSSPLRRLLDPLLKPKAANSHPIAEPLQKDSKPMDRACKPWNGQLDALTVRSGQVKLEPADCRTANVEDSNADKKHGSSAVQALLRVAFKNGLPLFTFAVDNESDILAATMKRLSTSRKDEYSWIYTFFTVREVKKKNGSWINQGGKGKSLDYIPNVVAQLKVSDYQFSNLIRQNSMDQFSLREFVLFAMDLRESDQQILDFQPNDELAAIIVKIPKRNNRSIIKDGPFVGCQDLISATVILPSGVHSLPSKGEPSSLIKRWNSGGACDCGGWDLGCKLRILANQSHVSNNSSSSKACSSTIRFELVSQGGIQESKPVFSLAPFKDSIYSVEFDSSLSLLQAFSICIAALDSRKLCGLSESSNLFEEKTCGETIFVQNDGMRAPPNQIDGEVPGRYASYPPHSPVGRV